MLNPSGSPSAQAAVTYLSANRIFAAYPVEVLCVAPGNDMPGVYSAVGISDLAADSFARRLGENRERAEAVAAGTAQRLGAGGYRARWSVSMGNAAHEIIEAAKSFGSGLVVMGSRGHTGLARIVLGSVARNVLLHSSASVLIVREPIRAPSAEPVGRIDGRPVAQVTAAGAC